MSRIILLGLALSLLVTACAAPTPVSPPAIPTATTRPFPTFPPLRTRTPTKTPRPVDTAIPTSTTAPATPTLTGVARSAAGQSVSAVAARLTPASPGQIARAALPALLQAALIKAGVNDPKVYWFTFDEGDREQALMVQYASPLRWQPGYLDMMRAAKLTVGHYYLPIDPTLYTAIIAATDITGQSDLVVRLRRSAAEKWARGDIGDADFANNYFDFVQIVVSCTSEACLAKMATPFPTFSFPFPFPTPTPKP